MLHGLNVSFLMSTETDPFGCVTPLSPVHVRSALLLREYFIASLWGAAWLELLCKKTGNRTRSVEDAIERRKRYANTRAGRLVDRLKTVNRDWTDVFVRAAYSGAGASIQLTERAALAELNRLLDAALTPVSKLIPGDRFFCESCLWTVVNTFKGGDRLSRKHTPESIALADKGYGYTGDTLCSFSGETMVLFVPPGAAV